MGRFINPFTDFGFKFLFGREVEKELLIDFLNDLLIGEHVITDIQFLNSEQQPEVKTERLCPAALSSEKGNAAFLAYRIQKNRGKGTMPGPHGRQYYAVL